MNRVFLIFGVLLMIFTSNPVKAINDSVKGERRIFLWDVTISMVGATDDPGFPMGTKRRNPDYDYAGPTSKGRTMWNYDKARDIFEKTRETLISQINSIKNPSTEIIVLPFRDRVVDRFESVATDEGKDILCAQIMGWNDLKSGGTHTGSCLKNALSLFNPARKNQVILLTDGEPSGNEESILLNILRGWKGGQETKGVGNRLVYVMLTQEAEGRLSKSIKEIASDSDGKISVITPNESISETIYVTLGDKASILVRDVFKEPKSSNGSGVVYLSYKADGPEIPEESSLIVSVEDNEFVEVEPKAEFKFGRIAVAFRLKKRLEENVASLPRDTNLSLTLHFKDNLDFPNIKIVDGYTSMLDLVLKAEPRVSIKWSIAQ